MVAPPISGRAATGFALAAVVLGGVASGMYVAAAGFAGHLSVPPLLLLASGPNGAALLRWGSIIDMFGYLSLGPVVLYLRSRYHAARYRDLLAAAGFAVVVIGSNGAVLMATAAPALINAYVGAGATQQAALLAAFTVLYRAVVLGMWQTLETLSAAVWLLGNAAAARREGPRSVFALLLAAGVANAAIGLYRLMAG